MSTSENGTKKESRKSSNKGNQKFRRERKEYDEDEHYFNQRHEDAIADYCESENDIERQQIYRDILDPAFEEMINKIMHTYKYHKSIPNKEKAVEECRSWIPTILSKFDPSKSTKAYSYFTVAIKNWFIQKIKKNNKKKKHECDYDDIPKYVEEDYLTVENTYVEDREKKEFFEKLKEDIQNWDEGRRGELLGKNDKKIVKALKIFFEKPEEIEMINKRSLYLYMREITDLNTKQISRSLKRLKERYRKFKKRYEKGDYDDGSKRLRRMFIKDN